MTKKRSSSLTALILAASCCHGAVIPVPGGDFQIKNPVDAQVTVPGKWKLRPDRKDACKIWLIGEGNGILAAPGTVLGTTIDVPALTEKEAGVKGDWTGIVHLDVLGTPKGHDGEVGMDLELEGDRLAGGMVRLRGQQAPHGPDATRPAPEQVWTILTPEQMNGVLGKKLTLRITVGRGEGVVLGGVGFCRVHSKPSRKLFGRSNGGLGPDLLGAGSLGFDGVTEHKQHALPVMTVRQGGPADAAGLKAGDVILDVNGLALPANDLAPGWGWFEHSHEAILGNAVQQAHASDGFGRVTLGILRDGELVRKELSVARSMKFTTMHPELDPVAAAMHNDLIEFLVKNQRDDGSWSRGPIRTTFAALALLATRDETHAERIKKAVDYLLNRYPEAENFGNLGFWHAAYAGMLYNEVIAAYSWWFALAWEPGYGLRFTTPHMGAPYMGTDDLINATYALVLASPKKTLHMTGATDRNWLDVSGLSTPVSEVRVKRDQAGLVTMAGRVPGPEVRYSLDGSEPGKASLKFEKPISLIKASTLKACVIGADGKPGPVGTWDFAPAKGRWKVVAASGHSDADEAIRRATRAIDGDPNKCWLTDVGQDSAGFPHFLVIDLGEPTRLNGLVLRFADKKRSPGKWIVKASTDAETKPNTIADGHWEEFAPIREITFKKPVQARYLRIEAVTGTAEDASALMIRELDMR